MGIKIKGVATCHGSTKLSKDDLYNKYGDKLKETLTFIGRDTCCVAQTDEENSLTMACSAAKKCLEKTATDPNDIDIIVFVSETPEYLIPTTSLLIKEKLGAKKASLVYDMNVNCSGMVHALDQVGTYMIAKPNYKKALIVGCICSTRFNQEDDSFTNSMAGDASAAIIVEHDKECGLIDSIYTCNSEKCEYLTFPACGLSNIARDDVNAEDKKFSWVPHSVDYLYGNWCHLITQLCERNNLNINDINHFLFSQFSLGDIKETLRLLNVDNANDKFTFVSNQFGYTGNTSPFIALNDAIENNKLKLGDKIIFCTVGAGYNMSAILYEY
ncbi:3-oxoacyl-[acyl-carrier-protein] synthase III C-terminal domain-containing protein [Clostridium sp.]|uniref:3-oxoacyl-ACP synthase III family protein n=1 Tax=Clostridium sp. TaxID=1506 RepID=UPI0032170051